MAKNPPVKNLLQSGLSLSATEKGNALSNVGAAYELPRRSHLINRGLRLPIAGAQTAPTVTMITGGTSGIASAITINGTDARFRSVGSSIGADSTFTTYLVSTGANPGNGSIRRHQFWSNAPMLEVRLLGTNSRLTLLVDGKRVSNSAQFSTDTSGGAFLLRVDWSSVSDWRFYEVVGFNVFFGGLNVGPSDLVMYPPELDAKPLVGIVSDSYGGGNGSANSASTLLSLMSANLGVEWLVDGISGTGWLSTGNNLPATRLAATMGTVGKTFTHIITALGYNDAGGSMSTLATNYAAGIAALKAAAPSAKIITLGPWTPLAETANLATVKTTLQSSAAAAGATFVDISTLVTTANKSALTGGDNIHPTNFGHEWLGARLAELVAPLM